MVMATKYSLKPIASQFLENKNFFSKLPLCSTHNLMVYGQVHDRNWPIKLG